MHANYIFQSIHVMIEFVSHPGDSFYHLHVLMALKLAISNKIETFDSSFNSKWVRTNT